MFECNSEGGDVSDQAVPVDSLSEVMTTGDSLGETFKILRSNQSVPADSLGETYIMLRSKAAADAIQAVCLPSGPRRDGGQNSREKRHSDSTSGTANLILSRTMGPHGLSAKL